MKDKIKEIILNYCGTKNGFNHFSSNCIDEMVDKIIATKPVKENDFIDGVVNCEACNDTGVVEGESFDDLQPCRNC